MATAARPYNRARLVTELRTLTVDATCLITVQRWQDPQRADRQWLVVLRNGEQVSGGVFTGRRIARLDEAMETVRQTWRRQRCALLTEEQADRALLSLAGKRREHCQREDCSGVLPMGRRCCQECGSSAGRVAAGLMSGASRRGVVVVQAR